MINHFDKVALWRGVKRINPRATVQYKNKPIESAASIAKSEKQVNTAKPGKKPNK